MTRADLLITLFSVGSAAVFAVFLHGCADEAALHGALVLEIKLRVVAGLVIALAVASSVWANRVRRRERSVAHAGEEAIDRAVARYRRKHHDAR